MIKPIHQLPVVSSGSKPVGQITNPERQHFSADLKLPASLRDKIFIQALPLASAPDPLRALQIAYGSVYVAAAHDRDAVGGRIYQFEHGAGYHDRDYDNLVADFRQGKRILFDKQGDDGQGIGRLYEAIIDKIGIDAIEVRQPITINFEGPSLSDTPIVVEAEEWVLKEDSWFAEKLQRGVEVAAEDRACQTQHFPPRRIAQL